MHTTQAAIQTLQQQSGFPARMFASILLLTITIIALTWYSFQLGHKMSSKFHPLVDAAMEIKLEATTAHLWIEESISGDRSTSLQEILHHFDNAIWYANAMIEGGQNAEGTFIALADQQLRMEISETIKQLIELKALTQQRHAQMNNSGAHSSIDQQYDKMFATFMQQADSIETTLQRLIADDLSDYNRLHTLLIITIITAFLIFMVMLYYYEKRRLLFLRSLKENLSEIKSLSALLPICSSCKKVRDDSGYWNQIEAYISTHTDAEFTHGICPDCSETLYGEFIGKNASPER